MANRVLTTGCVTVYPTKWNGSVASSSATHHFLAAIIRDSFVAEVCCARFHDDPYIHIFGLLLIIWMKEKVQPVARLSHPSGSFPFWEATSLTLWAHFLLAFSEEKKRLTAIESLGPSATDFRSSGGGEGQSPDGDERPQVFICCPLLSKW